LLRVKLNSSNYKPLAWSKQEKKFVEIEYFDIMEQVHFQDGAESGGKTFSDYELFFEMDLGANEIGFVKVVKTAKPYDAKAEQHVDGLPGPSSRLEIVGFTETDEVLFKLANKDQNFIETFGVALKYYKASQMNSEGSKGKEGSGAGAQVFKPDLRNGSAPLQYSKINPDVIYEQGRHLEQWTIKMEDNVTQ